MKKTLFSLMQYLTLVLVVSLLNSCGVMSLYISEEYQIKLNQPTGSEEIIGRVAVEGEVWETLVESTNYTPTNPPPSTPMGSGMRVNVTMDGRYYMIKRYIPELNILERQEIKRHPHEDILDELFNEAQKSFPNENIDIRNATEGYRYIGTGKTRRKKEDSRGNIREVEVPIYQFRIIYYADIVKITPLVR